MRLAIEEAKKSEGNLKIGALLVKKGKVISKGFKENVGTIGIHAEEKVIKSISDKSKCVLYLTLEPCFYRNYSLETCCDLIINSGIKKVVIGLKDINPKISGKGIEKLRSSGIKVIVFNKGLEADLLKLVGEDYIMKHGWFR